MEITKDDLKVMQHEIIEALDQRMDDKFRINNDLTRQEIKASENRLIQRMDEKFFAVDSKINTVEQKILQGVAEMLDDNIVPRIEDLDLRVTKLETKTASL